MLARQNPERVYSLRAQHGAADRTDLGDHAVVERPNNRVVCLTCGRRGDPDSVEGAACEPPRYLRAE